MKKILCALFVLGVFSGAYAGPEPTPACFEWLGNNQSFLKIYFDNGVGDKFPTKIKNEEKDCEEELKKALEKYLDKGDIGYYILGAASKTGSEAGNRGLSKKRMEAVRGLITKNDETNREIGSLYLGKLNANDATPPYNDNARDRSVVVCFGLSDLTTFMEEPTIQQQVGIKVPDCYKERWRQIKDMLAKRVQIENRYPMIAVERSVWKTADGKFNTACLLSDSIAGVVLGTAGGLITANVVKKNQIEEGFEDLRCTIGGQAVADWGDEFSVGRN